MRFLLTRPLIDSESTAGQLRHQDHIVHIHPLMFIASQETKPIDFSGYQALIFTSPNAIRAYDYPRTAKTIMVFAVGDKTAKTAQDAGFKDIISAAGNVEKLSETIKSTIDPKDGRLLYLSGSDVAGSIDEDLGRAQFHVDVRIIYKAKAAENADQEMLLLLKQGQIDYIPFYSPRSALIFKELIKKAGMEETLEGVTALCMSPATEAVVTPLRWKRILTAKSPNQSALFKLIDIDL